MMQIEDALRELGIDDYKIIGDEAIARCPSHDDRHPSWSINLRSGVHHCFSCGFAGNLASLVAHSLEIPYTEAVIWCNTKLGWARAQYWREDVNLRNYAPAKLKLTEASLALFTEPPIELLIQRGITREAAQQFGVLWDEEKQSWIFPIRDPYTHDLWGWQIKNGRTYRGYPAGVRKSETLYGLQAFEYGSPAILVESPIDVVRLYCAGFRGGLASYGVSVSAAQFAIILNITDSLTVALDNDLPGVGETTRICKEFTIPELRVFNYGSVSAKDPGELIDEEILEGMQNATSSIRWLRERGEHFSHGSVPVPARTSGQVSRQRKFAGRVFNGVG